MERHEKIMTLAVKFFSERRDVNPYASADSMRALDQLIRNGLADGLARAASAWRTVYLAQSKVVGVPTRENPFPDAGAMAAMRQYKALSDTLSGWVSSIHALGAPSSDRVFHRVRDNDQLLELLIETDYSLSAIADELDRMAGNLSLADAPNAAAQFDAKLSELDRAVKERTRLLSAVNP
jgi:hypothetical protein